MTLLAPTALVGLLLLAIPILVHLFKPRKMRRTPFSSLRWLKQTHQRLSRRIQWHQWLLFLLRAGVVVLLVLALAKPLIGSRKSERPTDRYIILDAGRGMGYATSGTATPLQQAQSVVDKLVEQSRSGDRTALLVAGASPQIITRPVADAGPHLPTLRSAKVGEMEQPITRVLPLVQALAAREEERDLELVFVTDQRRRGWRQEDIQSFVKTRPGNIRVQVVDAGPAATQNAWIAGARLLDAGLADHLIIRVELGCVGDEKQERYLRLAGIRDQADDVQAVTLGPGRISRVDFKVPASLQRTGQVAELRLEPGDALTSDDRWYVNLDMPWSVRVLLIEPPDFEAGRGPGLHLRAGLDALAESNHRAVRATTRSSRSVAAADFQQSDLILLAGVPDLPAAALEALEQRVRVGAGAILFLGEGIQTVFYQQQLHRALQPQESLLPLALQADKTWRTADVALLTSIRWDHPLLAPLRDPILSDLQQVRFRKHAAWVSAPGLNVLARIDDGEPALIEHPLGAGRVLIWNTSADDSWSDLPRRRSFIPLLDRMLTYLAGGASNRELLVGEPLLLPLPDVSTDETISVIAPSGAKLNPRLSALGGQVVLHLDQLSESGAYRLERGDKSFSFAVNVDRTGSPMTPMDAKALEAWWAPASVEVVSAESLLQNAGASSAWPLWSALIFLAGLLLLAETIYVHRLCPRSDPAALESIVPKHTVLQPLHKDPVST